MRPCIHDTYIHEYICVCIQVYIHIACVSSVSWQDVYEVPVNRHVY